MSLFRVILAIILPPLAVLDKGCGSILIVTLLTLAGWSHIADSSRMDSRCHRCTHHTQQKLKYLHHSFRSCSLFPILLRGQARMFLEEFRKERNIFKTQLQCNLLDLFAGRTQLSLRI